MGIKIDGGVDAGKIREDAPADVLKLLRSRESSWRYAMPARVDNNTSWLLDKRSICIQSSLTDNTLHQTVSQDIKDDHIHNQEPVTSTQKVRQDPSRNHEDTTIPLLYNGPALRPSCICSIPVLRANVQPGRSAKPTTPKCCFRLCMVQATVRSW